MRIPRKDILCHTGLFCKTWSGHNREPVFDESVEKQWYLKNLSDTYTDEFRDAVKLNSFCLMGNRTHEVGAVEPDFCGSFEFNIHQFGNWMRNGHSRFGAGYNARHKRNGLKRIGKVAYDRPKTRELKNQREVLTQMFRGDVAPVKAGKVSHPSRYAHSSYGYYAYGKNSQGTAMLTPPSAYLDLGKTPKQRQRKYRSLCDDLLRKEGIIRDRPMDDNPALTSKESCQEELEHNRGSPKTL